MERPSGYIGRECSRDAPPSVEPLNSFRGIVLSLSLALLIVANLAPSATADALAHVRETGELRYGSDAEGGGPYAFPDPTDPNRVAGFEVELMGLLCGALGPSPVFVQGQWDSLLPTLETGRIDVVVNGYEWTSTRADRYLATRPYYVFELQVMAPREGPIHTFDDLARPRSDGRPWRVAVLGGSAAEAFATDHGDDSLKVLYFNGATDAMMAVKNGQADATLQDLPAARFYRDEYPTLEFAGPPVGRGSYVMYVRKEDRALCDALDLGIQRLAKDGVLRSLYERYGIWTDAQEALTTESRSGVAHSDATPRGLALIGRYGGTLAGAAGLTIVLSVVSMPLAIAIGLLVALARLYGPSWLARLAALYVEILRGTPLMLQLYALYFLLPELGVELPAYLAGIVGLAINYSAYEAEIYRAGLQAIPLGQMEAALALGMTRGQALRRVIVPQAVRIVIPPVTNDFIALFKDTSVCSVISLVELTKQYSILANSTGGVVEFAALTAVLYLLMSLPLSWFSRWFESRLAAEGPGGGTVA